MRVDATLYTTLRATCFIEWFESQTIWFVCCLFRLLMILILFGAHNRLYRLVWTWSGDNFNVFACLLAKQPNSYKSQLTLTDPRDELRHVQSPIALYTELDDEYDQQVTVVGRLLIAFQHLAMSIVNIRVSPGSAETLLRWSEKIKQLLIAQSLSNAFAKSCENQITLDRVTAKNVGDLFLRHSV